MQTRHFPNKKPGGYEGSSICLTLVNISQVESRESGILNVHWVAYLSGYRTFSLG